MIELDAEIIGNRGAAGEDRNVLEQGFAPVAEAGALTAATFIPPRILLTTSVASASPSTSSATTNNGLPDRNTASSTGSSS